MYCEAVSQYCVFQGDRGTTKRRVVFDSSAKTYYGQSLNFSLPKGAKLQQDLRHILIRFRCYRIGRHQDNVSSDQAQNSRLEQ